MIPKSNEHYILQSCWHEKPAKKSIQEAVRLTVWYEKQLSEIGTTPEVFEEYKKMKAQEADKESFE